MSAWLRILIVAALCVVTLVGMVVRESMARASGTEILLPVEAVDPRSLLSGNYVTIRPLEALPVDGTCPSISGAPPLWIAFAPVEDHHRAVGASERREDAVAFAPIVARGEISCSPSYPPADFGWITVDLGFNRFHINQAEAQRIERILREPTFDQAARVLAIVSVGEDGTARLKGLIVDGERLELNWL